MLLALAGCATAPSKREVSDAGLARVTHPDSNTIQLEVALQEFAPAWYMGKGPKVWLVGVIHIAEPQYYKKLQQRLDQASVVLFEGVNAEAHTPEHRAAKKENKEGEGESGFSMQAALAKALGLVFQLDAIDYDRTNFVNSDLSIPEIQKLMAQTGAMSAQPSGTNQDANAKGGSGNTTFDALLEVMDGSSFLGSVFRFGIGFISMSPHLQAVAKVTLITAIGNLQGDIASIKGLPPEMQQLVQVLIQARNQRVMDDLKKQLATLPRYGSAAVFFGTGHMPDLEKRLREQLHYHPVKKIWLPALTVNIDQSGLSRAEAQTIEDLVKGQMKDLLGP